MLCLEYRDAEGRASTREVEPLCLSFWGGAWTLTTWCRHRQAFRNFRPDRIEACRESGETFDDVPGRNLEAYLDTVRGHYAGLE